MNTVPHEVDHVCCVTSVPVLVKGGKAWLEKGFSAGLWAMISLVIAASSRGFMRVGLER